MLRIVSAVFPKMANLLAKGGGSKGLTDPESMINHAYDYYSDLLTEKETSSQNSDVHEFTKDLHSRLTELPSNPFRFTINDLYRSIHQLKEKSSNGHKRVSNKLIKSIPLSHYSFILQTFNCLLMKNSYPDHWKLFKMILLLKEKKTFLSVDQTRTIFLLTCFDKIFKRCFLIYLRQWITDYSIVPFEQSDFRPGQSINIRFAHYFQRLISGLQQQNAPPVLYINFMKAFDQLWHDALIYKLHRLQFPSELLICIIEYLRNRQCFISMNHLICPLVSVGKRIPQGCCLGPTLFLLFPSQLPQSIPSASNCHSFADDLVVTVHTSRWWHHTHFVSQMQHLDQKVLNELARYATNWKQSINHSKSQWQWIHCRVTIPNLSLLLEGQPIERTFLLKYLGYYVDERLAFSQHRRTMLQTIQKNSMILKFVRCSNASCKIAREFLSPLLI